jgi:hypothetical protein
MDTLHPNQSQPTYPLPTGFTFASDPPSVKRPIIDTRTPEQRVQDDATGIETKINKELDAPRGMGYNFEPYTLRKIWDANSLSVECGLRGGISQPQYFDVKNISVNLCLFADLMPGSTAVDALDALIERSQEWIEALMEIRTKLAAG